jgi:GNAT superfamily N-acetyltransferase
VVSNECDSIASSAAALGTPVPPTHAAQSPLTLNSRTAQVPCVDVPLLDLRRATLDEILPLRHAVLRPGHPMEAACFDADSDATTRHFGAFVPASGENVCCVSCMRARREGADAWQVRGMATRGDLVRRGIGHALLSFAVAALRAEDGPRLLWCNARTTALAFWEREGWTIASDVFDIPGVGPHRAMRRTL